MNPFMKPQIHSMHHYDASSQRPSKKVPKMNTFGRMTDDLASTLFVGDLSVICSEINLYELFSRFGVIESVQLKKSDRDPQRPHLGFGFIKFSTRESAARALQEMNGYFFLDRSMRVGWALDFGKKGSQSLIEPVSDPKKSQTAQIHVMFATKELNRRVSELDLGTVFSRYGNLVDVAIKKHVIDREYGVQSGYAFLHFALTLEALKSSLTAVEAGHMLVVEGITYRCKLTHSMQAQLVLLRQKEEKKLGKRYFPPSLNHDFPHSLNDFTFETYNSPTLEVFSNSNFIPLIESEYHDKNFPSYHTNLTKTMSHTGKYSLPPPSLNPFSPNLRDFPSVDSNESLFTFSNDYSIMNEPSNCMTTTTATTTTAFPQHNLNDHHHLPARPWSSSFALSTYEDPSNNNKNNMINPLI